jgi:ABC-type branched-subunit amino acid transport system permease subunit
MSVEAPVAEFRASGWSRVQRLASRPSTRSLIGVDVAVILIVAVAGVQFGPYYQYIFALVAIFGIAALGNNVLLAHAGQLSVGQGGLIAIGAYAGVLVGREGANELVVLVAAAAAAGVAGLVLGLPALRLSGHFLAIVTLCFAVAVTEWLLHFDGLTGGGTGLAATPNPLSTAGTYYAAYALLIATIVSQELMLRGRIGRELRLLRASNRAAAAVGIDVARYKLGAFVYSGVLAGVAGALYGSATEYVSPTTFDLWLSIYLLVAVVLGGMNRPLGAVAGAAVVAAVPQLTTSSPGLAPVIFGVALFAAILARQLARRLRIGGVA